MLAKESEINLQPKGVEEFCISVMLGDWHKAVSLITELKIHKPDDSQVSTTTLFFFFA